MLMIRLEVQFLHNLCMYVHNYTYSVELYVPANHAYEGIYIGYTI